MITLGVSLYPEQEKLEDIDAYLELASKYGFTKVFTSMFSVEGTREEILPELLMGEKGARCPLGKDRKEVAENE